jgi:hypothetical protein
MNPLNKIRQIIQDHQAMNAVRKHNADVYLLFAVGQGWHGFDCYTCQAQESLKCSADPAKAILESFATRHEWSATTKGAGTTPILTTWQASFK